VQKLLTAPSLAFLVPMGFCLGSSCATAEAPAAQAHVAPGSVAAVHSEETVVSDALKQRGAGLVELINGKTHPEKVFAAQFLAQRAPEHLVALAGRLRGRFGFALGVSRIEASSPNEGTIYIDFEGSQLPFKVVLDPADPRLIMGLAVSS
jgi:hypothetical protein